MLWLVIAYLGSLVRHFATDNLHTLITQSVYRTIAIRSVVVASLLTIVDAILAMPIALPGIVTGIALNSAFTTFLQPFGIGLGLFTVIVGHATFCIVVYNNNVLARLRRVGATLEEASGDLGANTSQTFRYVTFPTIRSSLVAGALLAFALSFDEIVVTTFTSGASIKTLPQWIFENPFRPNQAPIINVVAACLILAFALPVWLSQRLSDGAAAGGRI